MNDFKLPSGITTIKQLKKGAFFTLLDYKEQLVSENVVWVRGDYDRSTKTYSCYKWADVCHEHFFKGSKRIFTNFIF